MQFCLKVILLVGATLASLVSPAAAVPMKSVWQGTLSESYDFTNTFGLGTGFNILDGQSYVLTFLYDPDTLNALRVTTPTSDTAGSFSSANTNPIQSITLSLAGINIAFDLDFFGLVLNSNDGATALVDHSFLTFFNDGVTYRNEGIFNQVHDLSLMMPISLDTPFSVTSPGLGAFNYFYYQTKEASSSSFANNVYGKLIPTSVSVSQVSAVPVPAALPLLVSGVCALGVMARRRKRRRNSDNQKMAV
jgi:hypothetical protein